MSVEASDSEDASSLSDVLPLCFLKLGLQGLARLAACSSSLKLACLEQVHSNTGILLHAAVQDVSAGDPNSSGRKQLNPANRHHLAAQKQHRQAVMWLLHASPADAVAASASTSDLLATPSKTSYWALQLVA
jgi:hypothetical protein